VHEDLIAIAIAEKEREVTSSGLARRSPPTEILLIDQRSETGEPK